jgi:hypothetical protein
MAASKPSRRSRPIRRFADSPKPGAPTSASPEKDVALAGPDGEKAYQLLRASQKAGAATLGSLARPAIKRLIEAKGKAKRLFDNSELKALGRALAATNATADLLGRSRIRRRADQVEVKHKRGESFRGFAESATDFTCFDARPIIPMPPVEALAYFRGLVPGLSLNGDAFAAAHERTAFTLAQTTDEVLLTKVQSLIEERLATGVGISTAPAEIDALLELAGVASANPQYAEMVFRTNMMDAMTTGAMKELQAVSDTFPLWKYTGIEDGRQRPWHGEHFGKYYDSSVDFADVRDSAKGEYDGYNCRCNFIPIDKWTVEEEGLVPEDFP